MKALAGNMNADSSKDDVIDAEATDTQE